MHKYLYSSNVLYYLLFVNLVALKSVWKTASIFSSWLLYFFIYCFN